MFTNDTKLIYLGIRSGMSKAGQPYRVLLVGNPAKYENYEFFLSDEIQVPSLAENEAVTISVEMTKRGYNLVPVLRGVTKWMKTN